MEAIWVLAPVCIWVEIHRVAVAVLMACWWAPWAVGPFIVAQEGHSFAQSCRSASLVNTARYW
jgi:hypothetical protein